MRKKRVEGRESFMGLLKGLGLDESRWERGILELR